MKKRNNLIMTIRSKNNLTEKCSLYINPKRLNRPSFLILFLTISTIINGQTLRPNDKVVSDATWEETINWILSKSSDFNLRTQEKRKEKLYSYGNYAGDVTYTEDNRVWLNKRGIGRIDNCTIYQTDQWNQYVYSGFNASFRDEIKWSQISEVEIYNNKDYIKIRSNGCMQCVKSLNNGDSSNCSEIDMKYDNYCYVNLYLNTRAIVEADLKNRMKNSFQHLLNLANKRREKQKAINSSGEKF